MTTTIDPAAADEAGRGDALADRLLKSMIGSAELASVWLGLRLHLYEALRDYAARERRFGGLDSR